MTVSWLFIPADCRWLPPVCGVRAVTDEPHLPQVNKGSIGTEVTLGPVKNVLKRVLGLRTSDSE